MSRRLKQAGALALAGALVVGAAMGAVAAPAAADGSQHRSDGRSHHRGATVRFATFNASLNRLTEGQLVRDLSTPADQQAATVAEIVQRVRPDVLLLNEFDFDPSHAALRLFQDNYLSVPHGDAARGTTMPISYRYRFTAPVNTGVASGFDLNNNGVAVTDPAQPGYGDDALGFGAYPGQFGLAVYSRYPIDRRHIRTFQRFLWKDMPGARLPDDPATAAPADWYSPAELAVFRLSSKSHWDLPLRLPGETVHVLVSHPTPPVFDGPEDRNGLRNFDEIRLWSDYVTPGAARYLYDDRGRRGGLPRHALSSSPATRTPTRWTATASPARPSSCWTTPASPARRCRPVPARWRRRRCRAGGNARHRSDPQFDTADFGDTAPGNLHADYVLPDAGLPILRSAVFWPTTTDPLYPLTGKFGDNPPSVGNGFPSSDHRLVWVDVSLKDRHDGDDEHGRRGAGTRSR
jgi:3-phytase